MNELKLITYFETFSSFSLFTVGNNITKTRICTFPIPLFKINFKIIQSIREISGFDQGQIELQNCLDIKLLKYCKNSKLLYIFSKDYLGFNKQRLYTPDDDNDGQ